ncbi:MAG: S1C family serine protease [Owenweeksia sp.]|nr:S1C family serine protease [Owenweeksia sp.]
MKKTMTRKLYLITGIISLFTSSIIAQSSLGGSLSNAVSINYKGNLIGSGFYYLNDSYMYLVTASHVLFKKDSLQNITDKLRFEKVQLKSYSKYNFKTNISVIEVDLKKNDHIKKHKLKDVCVVKIGIFKKVKSENDYTITTLSNVSVVKNLGKISGFSKSKILRFKDLEQGNEVRIIGYPKSLEYVKTNGVKLFEFEIPLLQSGVVSGLSSSVGNIITNAPIFYGNSGGAVLYRVDDIKLNVETQKLVFSTDYFLIGVATDFIPFILDTKMKDDRVDISNSGYSVIVPIDYALEIMSEVK